MTNSLTESRQKTPHTHRRLRSWTKRNGANLVFLAPFTVLFFTFTILPILAAIVLSFTYFNMVAAPTWVGFSNYVRMFFDDNVFLIALRNTAIFAMITGPISYILSFLIAWLINEFPHTLRTVLTLLALYTGYRLLGVGGMIVFPIAAMLFKQIWDHSGLQPEG